MIPEVEELKKLIEISQRILITSHISPDADAVTSALLVGRTLAENYPDKKIQVVLEEKPTRDLSFLSGYSEIKFGSLAGAVKEAKPDLFVITDANNYQRISRHGFEELASQLAEVGARVVVIDHHEEDDSIQPELLINDKRPATAEQVYVTFFQNLGLKKPEGYAETTLLGIISDTQRHRFDHPGYRETYAIVSELLDAGASIEKLEAKTEKYTKQELAVMGHLIINITNSNKGYTYSYVDDAFAAKYQSSNADSVALKNAAEDFVNRYIKYYEGNRWGFVVYPEVASGEGWWGVSFRALSGSRDVAALAHQLGGGGHKSAAGAKVQAKSAQNAVEQVVAATDG